MSTMPGNPHAEAAQPVYSSHQTHEQVQESLVYTQREATLALAFEQRTQTLLAVATATFADGSAMFPGQVDSVRRQIADRLGLGGGEACARPGVLRHADRGRAGTPPVRGSRERRDMSTWDAQSDRAAIRYYSDWCPDGIQEAHRRGARWQRQALLSDEAVERVARALCVAAGENPDSNELWDEEPPWLSYADEARAALTAAIGDDDE